MSPESSKALHQHRHNRSRSPRRRTRTKDFSDSEPIVERRRRQSVGLPTARRRAFEQGPDSGSDVEYLPDRFDSHGRPLSPTGPEVGWTERNGQFRRVPRHAGDWDVGGGWYIGGTNKDMVEHMAGNLRDVMDGRMSWLGLVSGMLDGAEEGRATRRRNGRLGWKDLLR